jgi:hypothetical protein
MKALYLTLSLLLCGVLFGAAAGCVVDFPEDLPYACQEDADCGGNRYVCAELPDARRYCCLPEPELCNGKDDNCDGLVDNLGGEPCYTGPAETRNVGACRAGRLECGPGGNILCVGQVLPTEETCNGKDDNCDGTVDEGFDFQSGQNNCGRCDQICTSLQRCEGGQCVRRREVACDDDQDNDEDGLKDCADPDCNGLSCGAGCVCIAGRRGEGECANDADDDGDGAKDCADSDCNEKPCGDGCVCLGGVRGEGQCGNGEDDDGDGQTDCADADCNEKTCGVGCVCRANLRAENQCDDGEDNDGDGQTDCADADCNNLECGVGCQCQSRVKAEVNCSDGVDNDGDGLIDCADPNCNGHSCVFGEAGAVCFRFKCSEVRCENSTDDDGDGLIDCDDPDCEGVLLNASPAGRLCTVNGPREGGGNACTDNTDNDGNGQRDCRTTGGATPDQNCLNGVCGVGCQYNNAPGSACTGKREIFCDDGLDNDGDGQTDCADQADCPQGSTCRKSNGLPGTCNASRQCG